MIFDSIENYLYCLAAATVAVFLWWVVRATEYLGRYPDARMPRWLKLLADRVIRGPAYLFLTIRVVHLTWFLLSLIVAFGYRVSLLDGTIKLGGINGLWVLGGQVLEKLLSPGDNSGAASRSE
jgi:hypothetical protein